jgi:hypothetical protein
MNIIEALQQEESKLQRQLTTVRGAISALTDSGKMALSPAHISTPNAKIIKKTMSAAVRARISRSAKARWAKIKAEKVKKVK